MRKIGTIADYRPDLETVRNFNTDMASQGFIAQQVLPVLNVGIIAGTFGIIPIDELIRIPDVSHNPRAAFARWEGKFKTDSYACVDHGLEEPVDNAEADIFANFFDAEVEASARCSIGFMRAYEKRVATLLKSTSTHTNAAATAKWNVYATATPIDDVRARRVAMRDAVGLWPNAMIITRKTLLNLTRCDQIVDKIEASGAGSQAFSKNITAAKLAEIFDLDKVLVADGIYNSTNEGQDAEIGDIWDNTQAIITRLATTNTFREPCAGRTFFWTGGGHTIEGGFESYESKELDSVIIRKRAFTQEKELNAALTQIITGVA